MAERRMFAKSVMISDSFLDMPSSARCLYVLLALMADDDGFISAPNSIMRMAGATQDDMRLLIAKGFIFAFASGVIAIVHWCVHNTIQKDRYRPTQCIDEKNSLTLDSCRRYVTAPPIANPDCIQIGSIPDTQDNIDQVNTDEARAEGQPRNQNSFRPPTVEEVRAYCEEQCYHINAQRFVDFYTARDWTMGACRMRDWRAAVRLWEDNERPRPKMHTSNAFLNILSEENHGST